MVVHTYTALPSLIDVWFQFLFHSPPGVLFTFPSRYSFTIGHQLVFSLTRWSGPIPTEFHVLYGTREHKLLSYLFFHLKGCHFLWLTFPNHSIKIIKYNSETVISEHSCLTTPISQHSQIYMILV
jgi:hypothetical protein